MPKLSLSQAIARTQGGTADRNGNFRCDFCGAYYGTEAGCHSRTHVVLASRMVLRVNLGLEQAPAPLEHTPLVRQAQQEPSGSVRLALAPVPERGPKAARTLSRLVGRAKAVLGLQQRPALRALPAA